jgi:hypothetical protein
VQLPWSENSIDKLIHFESIENELEQFSGAAQRRASAKVRTRTKAAERDSSPEDWLADLTSQMGIPSPKSPDSLCDRKQVWDVIKGDGTNCCSLYLHDCE